MTDPPWLDRQLYPFAPHDFWHPAGRVHYVDEGSGPPLVLLHGNDTWSFLYRHLIGALAGRFRCLAPDYLGFGLSEKPPRWSYRPADHAAVVAALVDALGLDDITLVVHDWGGPIGLSYAIERPGRVRRVVAMNTWMWPLRGQWRFEGFARLVGGPLGRMLVRRLHLFPRVLMPLLVVDKSRWDRKIRAHYVRPQPRPADRAGVAAFPRHLLASTPWLEGLWARRRRLARLPALLVWGLRDPAFRRRELRTWEGIFHNHVTLARDDAGHYVAEDLGPELAAVVGEFLGVPPAAR
ncbi:MAG: alpha/beta fold hydrolase [Candidatus Brocadiia bacterium]